MFNREDLERVVVLEYDRVLDKASLRYGRVDFPKVYVPRLDEEDWKREVLPERDSAKFYGAIFFEPTIFVVNTWAFLREMESFGEEFVRRKVCETLCHEVAHYARPGLTEVEINIEGERLLRLVREG